MYDINDLQSYAMNDRNSLPESPETPSWGPPSQLPESPETPNWGPPSQPSYPSFPSIPSSQLCNVRFIHAAVSQPAFRISINNRVEASFLQYSNINNYGLVPAGNVTVTVRVSTTNNVVNQTRFRLDNGGIYTIAIVNSANGVALFLMEDTNCNKSIFDSCVRIANLTNRAPALDILADNQLLYKNVSFLDVTNYRQFQPNFYTFNVTESKNCGVPIANMNRAIQIIPIIVGSPANTCYQNVLASSRFRIQQNRVYTIYIIGNAYSRPNMSLILAESYFEY